MKTHNTDKIIEQILEQLKKCTDPDLLDLILKLLLESVDQLPDIAEVGL